MLKSNTMRFGTDEFEFSSMPTLYARVNGENMGFLCTEDRLSVPAIGIRFNGTTYYIYLVNASSSLASSVRIRIDGTVYALASAI